MVINAQLQVLLKIIESYTKSGSIIVNGTSPQLFLKEGQQKPLKVSDVQPGQRLIPHPTTVRLPRDTSLWPPIPSLWCRGPVLLLDHHHTAGQCLAALLCPDFPLPRPLAPDGLLKHFTSVLCPPSPQILWACFLFHCVFFLKTGLPEFSQL